MTGFGSKPGPVFLGLLVEFLSAEAELLGEEFLPGNFEGCARLNFCSVGLDGFKDLLFLPPISDDSLFRSLARFPLILSFEPESFSDFRGLFVPREADGLKGLPSTFS